MDLKFPEGYHIEPMPERKTITLNRRSFTPSEFAALTEREPGEKVTEHSHRLARALGIGCVTSHAETLPCET
jgi:hypothetical protein